MKLITLITSILLATGLCANSAGVDFKKTDTLMVATSAVCEMCVATIEEGFAFEKGVKSARVNLDSNTVTIVYKANKTNPDILRTALTEMGYAADSLPPNPKAYDKLHHCCKIDNNGPH